MFRRKEKQSLINASRKALAKAEETIQKLSEELIIARHNNEVLVERNREQATIIKKLEDTISNKINELAQDHQSETSSK